jgi:UDP-N-acetylmuramyl pentapeptide phosphotransferase/UDP-N-acetylglucosamine-1-phosphate transferase
VSGRGRGGRLLAAGAGLALGRLALSLVRRSAAAGALERTNYRGRRVDLAGGPALAFAASVAGGLGAAAGSQPRRARLAAATVMAGLGAGAAGIYDDMAGAKHHAKGFRGHLRALREGRVTTGAVKIVGISAAALAAASLLPARRPHRRYRALDVVLGAGVIAGTANLVNLLDLRPGRALKASLALSILDGRDVAAGAAGAAVALLGDDLGERTMIGDSGANAIGAVLGVAAAARTGTGGRAVLLAALAALTAASEKVSFTAVIEATPALRALDRLGRQA